MWRVALGSQIPGTDNGIFLWWNLINFSSRTDNTTQSQGVLLGDVLSTMSCVLTTVLGWNCCFGLKQAAAPLTALAECSHPSGQWRSCPGHICAEPLLSMDTESHVPVPIFIPGCYFATPSYDFLERFAIKCKTLGVCTQTRAVRMFWQITDASWSQCSHTWVFFAGFLNFFCDSLCALLFEYLLLIIKS